MRSHIEMNLKTFKAHMFIQWLTHKGYLVEWLELTLRRADQYHPINNRHLNDILKNSIPNASYGIMHSFNYTPKWQMRHLEWQAFHDEIVHIVNAEHFSTDRLIKKLQVQQER